MNRYAINDRAVITVTGVEAEHFLQNLITLDINLLSADEVRPAALLTPQGKIAYPFLISRIADGFRLETASCRADDLNTRFNLYRLRAKVTVENLGETPIALTEDEAGGLRDVRFPDEAGIGRLYEEIGDRAQTDDRAVAEIRIRHCVPEEDSDYTVGDAFAFDALLDQLGGLSVKKGCFIGQEVVSRMHHRGTARRRVVKVLADQELPGRGTSLDAAGKPVGEIGTVVGQSGLAMVRIDRVATAIAQQIPVTADNVEARFEIPERFSFSIEPGGES
ncbi:YgfZ/GcvT domain-containing protein [Notoacmeibacter ruber]|uniref:Folate-binding protein n=1 Tax=Notoacmeibacter ruber TaxID=2670375 RepID=A0A3L7JA22_9HYPH|nr:folate-binding protein YgfZ [Notoacmeibacter ruber]RLQ87597.1 folate-binding protein [Notoacmeibacter ruber]